MDTDIETYKPFDTFLNHKAFTCFENNRFISLGAMGAEKGTEIIKYMLDYYDGREFLDPNQPSGIDWTPNVIVMTEKLAEKGLVVNNQYQDIEGLAVYPSVYFSSEGIGENKYATHYFTSTWLPKKFQRRNAWHRRIGKVKKAVKRVVGDNLYYKLKKAKKHNHAK